MRVFIFISLISIITLCLSPYTKNKDVTTNKPIQDTLWRPVTQDTISYARLIQPILVTHCSPCHFPGGKLYDKLPFDNPETILNHQPGVFKRIKDVKEIQLIKDFIHSAFTK
jgi:hypothetical protein